MRFQPIAITGRACVLPGAVDVGTYADNLFAGRDDVTEAPEGRWRLEARHALDASGRDSAWSSRGGYVTGFERVFDASSYALEAEFVRGLDPLVQWSMHCARGALVDADVVPSSRVGVVLGNLSFPSESMAEYGERVWLEENVSALPLGWQDLVRRPDAHNRFMSGLPAHLVSRALGLGRAFALDAACATSLYALQLAAFQLRSGEADVVLAGAVNRADSLFLHVGFCALNAMSRTGQSRPFHAKADGLVPAEGAAFLALERLEDAQRRGRPILGVLRGIGLSNDGRGRGFLAPARAGQVRALRAAYAGSDVAPTEVGYIECHATGTQLGDATELESIAEVFGVGVPLGSHKSNFGHAITVAGLAGVLKVLAVFEREEIPPTLHLEEGPGDVVTRATDFGGRFAAVNAFGFGGNNAHILLEKPGAATSTSPGADLREPQDTPLAIVALELDAGAYRGADAVFDAWLRGADEARAFDDIALDLDGLRFPPRDLEQTLGQQLAILDVARRATAGLELDPERTSVLVGMGCDPEIVRYGARWRMTQWAETFGWSDADTQAARDAFVERLEAQGVIGSMPNVVANRINSQLDVRGPSFSVSSEELSGLCALEVARSLLRYGQADTVIVGAVELAAETVHRAAHAEVVGEARAMGDAAIVLVVQRLEDAVAAGREIVAVLDPTTLESPRAVRAEDVREVFGDTHAASSLLAVGLAARSVEHAAIPGPRGPAPAIAARPEEARVVAVHAEALGGQFGSVTVESCGAVRPVAARRIPRVHSVDGDSRADVVARLRGRRFCDGGPVAPHRVAFVATPESRDARADEAARLLESGRTFGTGIHYREAVLGGELAFVFTGSASAYSGMAAGLSVAVPSLVDALGERLSGDLRRVSQADADVTADPRAQIAAVSWVSLLHAALSLRVLGLRPDAAIGYSLGESTALMALDAWGDLDQMLDAMLASPLFASELCGDFTAVRKAWAARGEVEAATGEGEVWQNWTIVGDVARTAEIVASEPSCHVTIINTDDECSIGGSEAACGRVLERLLDDPRTHATAMGYSVAIHAPEVTEAATSFRALHHRPTRRVEGVRFYSNATGRPYELGDDATADALLAQATDTVDFRRTILNAWEDGVRIFVEHGPRGLCTGWIRRVLGPDREHLAVSLDRPAHDDVEHIVDVCAQLVAAGVEVDWRALVDRLAVPAAPSRTRPLRRPAHKPPVRLPGANAAICMPPAPTLPPIIGARVTPAALVPAPPAPQPVTRASTRGDELDIGALHAAFLRTQAAVHEQFLAHFQAGVDKLVEAYAARGATTSPPAPVAPVFSREDLEYLAHGEVSRLFGPRFREQDQYPLQVRMPRPPLLLCDRVTQLDAEPASMQPGRIVTETDVTETSWYLHQGRMPAGIMIESGQADLLLVSYLGADLLNKGERAYRLLGCKLTYTGALPEPGDTLVYDIEIDGFAKHDEVRLFFFHYDCRIAGNVRLQVRGGQAGFFTREELDRSGGILWSAETGEHDADAVVAQPAARPEKRWFDADELRAFADGRPWDCFGPGWDLTRTHWRTPTISAEPMLFLDRVAELDFRGGPWGKGYLRAEADVDPQAWFFDGHFHNDPCMPGTLMFEGALQAMAFYLAANGFTIDRDGWRFQPVQDVEYEMRCRGQVDPGSRGLTYEIFVEELHDGAADGRPRLFADMLVTVDGLKAFWCRRMGLELVPDYPLRRLERGDLDAAAEPLADEARVRAAQIGWPSDAFGAMYERFDGHRRVPRLPGPPYDAVSRVVRATGRGAMESGAQIVTEFDVDPRAWFFAEADGAIPLAVLLEAALQPCGWLASWVGCTLQDDDVFFRNLDGTARLHRPATPDDAVLTIQATLTRISRSGPMTIVAFDVQMRSGTDLIHTMETVFGFFPAAALASQAGIKDAPPLPGLLANDIEPIGRTGRLGLLDRVVARSERRIICEMDVDAGAWFFQAHFFSDPVQPGSLGLQLIADAFALLGAPIDLTAPHSWKYRGQVRPHNRVVTIDAAVEAEGLVAHLWADGSCIYRFSGKGAVLN